MDLQLDNYAVIGAFVEHSLSPLIFQEFARQTGQLLNYQAISVQPEALVSALENFRQQQFRGLNLTAPLKEKAFSLVHACSERAVQAKAINMLSFREDGSLYGDNSDGVGFVRDLAERKQYSLANKTILVLGAGGAVRGVVAAILAEKPAKIFIANRSPERAQLLVEDFAPYSGLIQSIPWNELKEERYHLIINGTSATPEQALALPDGILAEQAFCYDLAYGRGLTSFLSWGRQQGATCCDGLGMLIEQAAEAFYLWRNCLVNKELTLPIDV